MAKNTNAPTPTPTTLEDWVKLLDGVRLPVPQASHDRVCRALRDSRSSVRKIADLMQDSPA
ncbi:MAG: HDOD domain-containing protein, partial [Pseudomonas sp.]